MAAGWMREREPAAPVQAVADAAQRNRLVALWALARAARQWRRFKQLTGTPSSLERHARAGRGPAILIRAVPQTDTVDRS